MAVLQPFNPNYNNGQQVSAASASAYITVLGGNKSTCVTNLGTNVAYVRISNDTGKTASQADMPVLPGAQIILTKSTDDNVVSYISPSGTTLHVITGEGW